MTRRLIVIAALGLLAVAATGGYALTRHPSDLGRPAPHWGVFTEAQWRTLSARARPLVLGDLVTAMPGRDGTALALVAASRGGKRCFVLVRGLTPGRVLCALAQPLVAFARTSHGETDVVGLAAPRVTSVVASWPRGSSGAALLPAGRFHAFGMGFMGGAPLLTARDLHARVVARLDLRRR